MKIAILGMGKMGEAVASGLKRTGKAGVTVTGTTRTKGDNAAAAAASEVVLLSVKPHQAEKVLREIAPRLTAKHLLISICAAVTTDQLREWSGARAPVIRAMPNTPCLMGEGMTVFAAGAGAEARHLKLAEEIFGPLGRVATLEESHMDAVTGLSGCGPAYVYLMIEALSDAGVKVGLPRDVATLLAAQTLQGSARMVLERGTHPAALKDEVTTPAGCTIDGLMALEEGKLRVTLIKAVVAATRRSERMREGRAK
jgi:pyrroline-5-carboxylate reductase